VNAYRKEFYFQEKGKIRKAILEQVKISLYINDARKRSEMSCVEEIIHNSTHFLGDTWIEFPVGLTPSGLKCDPTLTPTKIIYLRLPEGALLLSKLRTAWGYQGFYL